MRTKISSALCFAACLFVVLGFVVLGAACGGSKSSEPAQPAAPAAPAPSAEAKPAAPAPAAQPVAAATAAIDDPTFSLHLVEAGPYKAGELARVVISLEPHGVYHVNQEYPIEIALSGDADTSFPKAKLERADAAEFAEKKAKFDVPFSAKAAGDHKLLANVKFAVCTPENCVPDERNLALTVAVK